MTSDLPLVSIITPVCNGGDYIEDLIRSVQAQDHHRIEHLVIDDGSTDGGATVAVLKRFPHLRWWSRENRGQYATMNEGLEAAQGEIVCFVSADDVLAAGSIRRAMEFLRTNPGYTGVYGFTAFMHQDGRPYLPIAPFRRFPLKYYAYLWHVSHCSLYIRKDILVEKKLYFDASLRYVGDYDWMIRLVNSGIRIGKVNETLSWIRVHDSQISVRQRGKMKLERKKIAKANHLHPIVYSFSTGITIWIHNCYKLFFTIRQAGLLGGARLIKNWLRR